MTDDRNDPRALDVDSVTAWWLGVAPALEPPISFELIAGGRSNLTFRVEDRAGRTWVLRRPPVHSVLPTAHDMVREHRIIAALHARSDVPVPGLLGSCDDVAVTGAPFYVMEFVDGVLLRDAATAAAFPAACRPTASAALVDVLARLHRVDVDAVGLGDLGRREGYVERQLGRWWQQYQASGVGADDELVGEVHRRLGAAIPRQQAIALVHGDYRLDNVVLSPAGAVRAVLDWELCTLGDPLADLGLLHAYWFEPGDELADLLPAPTTVPGFGRRVDLTELYASTSTLDLSDLDFYIGFANWKLACILHGVASRYAAGASGGDASGAEVYRLVVAMLARRAADAIGIA